MSEFDHVHDLVPGQGRPFQALRIVEYFDEDGVPRWRYDFEGSVPRTALLGLIEIVKFDLLSCPVEEDD